MKLTRLQRHTAYIIMLAEFEEEFGSLFFCTLMYLFSLPQNQEAIRKYFPELWAKKPRPTYTINCWFMSSEKGRRIDILKQCIKETA